MSHARKVIRDKVVELLGAIPDITVINSRVYPMVNLPIISVYTVTEASQSENDTIGTPRRYTRRMVLDIAVAVSEIESCEDVADAFAAECEQAMAADVTLAGLATDSTLTGTNIEASGDGEKPVFITHLLYEIWYRTTAEQPGTAI